MRLRRSKWLNVNGGEKQVVQPVFMTEVIEKYTGIELLNVLKTQMIIVI